MKTLFSILTVLLIIMSVSSCNDELVIKSDTNFDAGPIVYSSNPLDSIGLIHNEIMNKFVVFLEESYLNGDFDDVTFPSSAFKDNVSNLLDMAYDSTTFFATSSSQIQQQLYDSLNIDNWFTSTNYNLLFDDVSEILNNHASSQDSLYTINLINDIKDLIVNGTSNDVFEELESIVNSHEALILAQAWDSTEVIALSTIAVAKYSTQFWNNFFLLHSPNMARTSKDSKKNIIMYTNKEKSLIIAADAAGAIVGSIKVLLLVLH